MVNIDLLFSQPEKTRSFIVAEIGINHNGSFEFAKTLIDSAKASNADAVKFQVFQTEKFYNPHLAKPAFDLFKSLELSYDAFSRLKEYAESNDLLFFATPLDFESLDFLIQIKSPIIKIASSDITNEPFLYKIKERNKKGAFKVFLSTGFVNFKKINRAVSILKNCPLSIQYCISKYPAEDKDFDLNFISTLKNKFKIPVGFSDHSLDIYLSLAAVSLGAKVIERHFTTDNKMEGADHKISLNPAKFQSLVKGIREIESALGDGQKKITSFEREISYSSMRDIYSARPIKKGERISEKDLVILRPGNGVNIKDYKNIIQNKSIKDLKIYEKI